MHCKKLKKQVMDNFQVKIRSLNQFSQSTNDLYENEHFVKNVEEEINLAQQKLCDFVPKFAVVWHIKMVKTSSHKSKFSSQIMHVNNPREYYDNMNDQLKECFVSMPFFPENAIIKSRGMIYWWIGEGSVNSTPDETSEVVGEQHMRKPLTNNLITPLNQQMTYMTVDPTIRHKAISDAKRCKFFTFDSDGIPTSWFHGCPPHACSTATHK